MIKLNAQELRSSCVNLDEINTIPKNSVTIILDNVLDTYNVGAIFRLADAVAAQEVILCGATLTPPNSRIKKASINTTEWVNWKYEKSAIEAITKLKALNPKLSIIAVEQDERSLPFSQVTYTLPIAVVVGNETYGVSKDVLSHVDTIVELPMWGVNKSLNVMVSCGIVLYEIMKQR